MTIAEQIGKLVQAQAEAEAIKSRLEDYVQTALRRYMKASHLKSPNHGGLPEDSTPFDWTIWPTSIRATWEETWSRGGHDSGGFEMPLLMLMDNGESLAAYEADCKQNAGEAERRRQEADDRSKLQQLELLQKWAANRPTPAK